MDTQNIVPVNPKTTEQAAWVPATPGATQPPVPAAVPKKGMPLILKFMIGCGALFFILPILFVILIVAINPADKLQKAKEELEKTASSSAAQVEKDKTSDWKTYRSEVGKFEIKYPNKLNIQEGNAGEVAYIRIGEGVPDTTVIVSVTEDARSVPTNAISTRIDGVNAQFSESSDLALTKSYYVNHNNLYYYIELSRTIEEDADLLNSILSTFKFL